MITPVVYLIHFEVPYVRGDGKEIRHYLGATQLGLEARLWRHLRGDGAALLRAVTTRGIRWSVVRTWPVKTKDDAFQLEIALKKRRRHKILCPVCSPASSQVL